MDNLKPPVWVGGETEALSRLERHLERKAWVASFGRPKMTPQSLLPSQTGLSPYLRFGCLSTRLFYHALRDLYKKVRSFFLLKSLLPFLVFLGKENGSAVIAVRPTFVEGIFLLCCRAKPKLRPHVRQSHLCSNPLGQEQ